MRLIDAEQIGLTDMEIIMCDGDYKKALEMLIDKIANAPTIDAVPVQDGILKARKGDYVTYRIDYLLDHLAMEIYLLEGYMRGRKEE